MKPKLSYAECAELLNNMQKQNAYCEALKVELQQYRDFAAEYGVDARTMLTLAKSQIATARDNAWLTENNCELRHDNIALRAERDALLKQLAEPTKKVEVE